MTTRTALQIAATTIQPSIAGVHATQSATGVVARAMPKTVAQAWRKRTSGLELCIDVRMSASKSFLWILPARIRPMGREITRSDTIRR